MNKIYQVHFLWDNEASVWVATSDDVPGLVLEHESFDALIEKVTLAAPELLMLNCGIDGEIRLSISITTCERVANIG